jgi:hypothetical protein
MHQPHPHHQRWHPPACPLIRLPPLCNCSASNACLQAEAGAWLSAWFSAAPLPARCKGLLACRPVLLAKETPRLGLQQLVRAVVGAAQGAAVDGQLLREPPSPGGAGAAGLADSMLQTLSSLLYSSASYSGRWAANPSAR